MALPSTGPLAMSQVRTELGATGSIALGSAPVRGLAGVPSGTIKMSNLLGKANAGTLVAGFLPMSLGQSITGYSTGSQVVGSLTPIPRISVQPSAFKNQNGRGSLTFPGNVVAEMTGKLVYIDGVAYAMEAPVYYAQMIPASTIWNKASGLFPFVEGGRYAVTIG